MVVLLGDCLRPRCRFLPAERRLLRVLVDAGIPVSNTKLVDHMWGDREDGGPLNAVRMLSLYAHRIRKKLLPGYAIGGYGCLDLTREI